MSKIYCFVNSGVGTDFQSVLALAEDGHFGSMNIIKNIILKDMN